MSKQDPKFKKDLDKLKKSVKKDLEKIPKVFVNPSFDLIFQLIDATEIQINVPKYEIQNNDARLIKNPNGSFIIEIENIVSDMKETYDIEMVIGENTFLANDVFFSLGKSTWTRNENNGLFSGNIVFTGEIHEIKSDGYDASEEYNRFIIPTNVSHLDYYIKSEPFRDELRIHGYGKLKISIDNHILTLYTIKVRDQNYFIIDSNDPMNHDLFADLCHSVMIGFGFISGDFIQGEAFYLTSENKDFGNIKSFTYQKLRPSLISHGTCNPVYSNPYGYTDNKELVDQVGNKIEVFNSELFSRLCTNIYTQDDYATVILLMLEAHVSSLVLRPAGYSVALEKITNIIVAENKGLKPIPDKQIAKKFRKELTNILHSFKDNINEVGNEDSLIIIQKNIDKINNPTNRDKLTKPFKIHGIELSEREKDAISNRNNFLHGRNINVEENQDEYSEVFQISYKLNHILNKLILKHLGFSGYIINHLKHNESSIQNEIDEPLFEEI